MFAITSSTDETVLTNPLFGVSFFHDEVLGDFFGLVVDAAANKRLILKAKATGKTFDPFEAVERMTKS